jgi:voltage-gated potassium channel
MDSHRERWERYAEWPMAVVAVVFLVAYAWPIMNPGLSRGWSSGCSIASWASWAAFPIDYGVRLTLSKNRWRFVSRHLLDLAVVALPLLRPLRLLRLLTLLSVLQRRAAASLRGRVTIYLTASAALLIFCAALAVLDAERDSADSNIKNFGDALWWAGTTVTTVGYGDRYPTTGTGRMVGAGLMVAGIAVLGLVTATLASWFIERVQQSEQVTRTEVQALTAEIASLRQRLETDQPSAGRHEPAQPISTPSAI